MKTLDRYIIRQFLLNYVILFFVLMSLFVLVDLMVDLDEFLKAGQVRAEEYGGPLLATVAVVADFYGPMIVLAYVYFSSLLVVGAMGFTLSSLHRTRELVAMVTSGWSMYRIAAPLLATGCLLSLLVLPCQELIIPKLAPKLVRSKSQVKYESVQGFPVYYAPDGKGHLVSAARFDAPSQSLAEVTILVRNEQGQAVERISASQAHWNENDQGWDLVGGYAISRSLDDLSSGATLADPQPTGFFASDLSPQVLLARRARFYPRFLSLAELGRLKDTPAVDAGQRRAMTQVMHSRFSLLVVGFLVQVLALRYFLLREPANMLLQAVKAAGVCMGAWGLGMLLVEAGLPQVSPLTTAWLPVVLLLPICAGMLTGIRT